MPRPHGMRQLGEYGWQKEGQNGWSWGLRPNSRTQWTSRQSRDMCLRRCWQNFEIECGIAGRQRIQE